MSKYYFFLSITIFFLISKIVLNQSIFRSLQIGQTTEGEGHSTTTTETQEGKHSTTEKEAGGNSGDSGDDSGKEKPEPEPEPEPKFNCSENCSECKKNTDICVVCKSGFYLKNNKCVKLTEGFFIYATKFTKINCDEFLSTFSFSINISSTVQRNDTDNIVIITNGDQQGVISLPLVNLDNAKCECKFDNNIIKNKSSDIDNILKCNITLKGKGFTNGFTVGKVQTKVRINGDNEHIYELKDFEGTHFLYEECPQIFEVENCQEGKLNTNQKICEDCNITYFLNDNKNKCLSCAEEMPGCQKCIEKDQCIECYKGYFHKGNNGSCEKERDITKDENCQTYTNNDLCSECKNNYFLNGYGYESICEKCPKSCNNCTSSTKCNECSIGYIPDKEGNCVSCFSLMEGCQVCISPEKCSVCFNDTYTLQTSDNGDDGICKIKDEELEQKIKTKPKLKLKGFDNFVKKPFSATFKTHFLLEQGILFNSLIQMQIQIQLIFPSLKRRLDNDENKDETLIQTLVQTINLKQDGMNVGGVLDSMDYGKKKTFNDFIATFLGEILFDAEKTDINTTLDRIEVLQDSMKLIKFNNIPEDELNSSELVEISTQQFNFSENLIEKVGNIYEEEYINYKNFYFVSDCHLVDSCKKNDFYNFSLGCTKYNKIANDTYYLNLYNRMDNKNATCSINEGQKDDDVLINCTYSQIDNFLIDSEAKTQKGDGLLIIGKNFNDDKYISCDFYYEKRKSLSNGAVIAISVSGGVVVLGVVVLVIILRKKGYTCRSDSTNYYDNNGGLKMGKLADDIDSKKIDISNENLNHQIG